MSEPCPPAKQKCSTIGCDNDATHTNAQGMRLCGECFKKETQEILDAAFGKDNYIRKPDYYDIIEQAEKLCRKFIYKVESGKAHSKETYQDCKGLIEAIESYKKFERDNDIC
jgi:hypothetical protein